MSAATAPVAAESEPGERGSLTVADRVVERVAGHAVTLVDDAIAAPRRVLGLNVGQARPDDHPHLQARVEGSTATVETSIAVRWPASVHSVVGETRRRIRAEVARIADVRVDHIDVDVTSMNVPTAPTPRVR